jgi:hypothetical protein
MPIKTLQQQQAQVGRIRLGEQKPGKSGKRGYPARLSAFRFTTPSESLARAVAGAYGGEVQRWEPDGRPAEWEVYSVATEINVLVPPHPVSQWMEMWSGQGCVRRCDGETETISGEACKCPLDPAVRAEQAQGGSACHMTTRLNVMLPDLPGVGVWRLDTHGYYAALELPQTAEFLGAATAKGGYVRATLALQKRQVRRPGVGVREFLVPALHVEVSPLALRAGEGVAVAIGGGAPAISPGAAKQLEAGRTPEEQAQDFANLAASATTPEELRAIYTQAGQGGATVMEAMVDDGSGVLESLSGFLTARGRALAAPSQPSGDVDVVWATIMSRAGDRGIDTDTVKAAFRAWSNGTEAADATAEQMQGFLDEVYSDDPVEAAAEALA